MAVPLSKDTVLEKKKNSCYAQGDVTVTVIVKLSLDATAEVAVTGPQKGLRRRRMGLGSRSELDRMQVKHPGGNNGMDELNTIYSTVTQYD
jgi:hypothetical protein